MIGKLKGIVDFCLSDHAIIDVGGVGYLVYCSLNTLNKLEKGKAGELFISTHVREDHIHLYGFISQLEKEYFILLQSVGGIGARMAIAILSGLTPDQICLAIAQKNKDAFKSISGVGAKLAERILIELKDKIKVNITDGYSSNSEKIDNNKIQDGVSALVYLGVNKPEAQNIIQNILSQSPDIKTDELIKRALLERKR